MNKPNIIIITGMSGSGKSTALAAMEDTGFFCVDNLPIALLPKFLELHTQTLSEVARFAFVMDLRKKSFVSEYNRVFAQLEQDGFFPELIFLEAEEKELLRRYSETRRHHPLSGGKGVAEGIATERERLAPVREIAHKVIDTSHYNVHELKQLIRRHLDKTSDALGGHMRISVLSFGFKYGIPHDSDLVVDVRFLPNPYFVPELKNLTGEYRAVQDFVLEHDETREFLQKYLDLIDYLIPRYEREGKAYLTIAVGCTGGQHRSVSIAGRIFEHLGAGSGSRVSLTHRDIRPEG